MDVKITGLMCVQNPKPNKKGDTIVAYFDCKIDWLTMEGAALVKLASNGKFTIWEPLGKDTQTHRRSVKLDRDARWATAEAALPVFKQFGGCVLGLAAEI